MLFNSYHFFAFLFIVLTLNRLFHKNNTAQKGVLLLASYYFYGQWNWTYLVLILTTTTVDFFVARRIYCRWRPRAMFATSLCVNLGILFFFKYANFIVSSTNDLSQLLGHAPALSALDLLLPVGISFYTFQSMSYTIDVYRGKIAPRRKFLDYALFVSFFPQLVAGPIIRAKTFFRQLDAPHRPAFNDIQRGVSLIILGLVKKTVFADNLATVVDGVFNNPASSGGWETLLGVYAFAFQIYFDFSGYSDIAIGVAELFSFKFPKNFDHPYLSLSLREFWRRWHISLSTWLRDYLYFGVGGSRGTALFTYRNIMITMLLGGLWHGASWTFVIWGAIHGIYLLIERQARSLWPAFWESKSYLALAVRWFLTFQLVSFAWIFFRSNSLADSLQIISNLATIGLTDFSWAATGNLWVFVGFFMFLHWITHRVSWPERVERTPAAVVVAVHTLAIISLILLTPDSSIPFIYFQF
ncbi:MAG: MBOAT family O-acyltransferase [Thermodesulfobacteriota bacterium]